MPGRPRGIGERRRWRSGKARRRGVRALGLGTAAGAFLALGMSSLATAPRAHADLEDLIIQPILDAIGQAASLVDPSFASAADPGVDVGGLLAPAAAAADVSAVNATVPLQVNDVTEPVVDVSVGGGPAIPVLVDTGSNGLVVPWWDVGLQNLGLPTGWGISGYSGGLEYLYLTFPETVNFGNGIVTAPTSVDVELFAWPTSFQGSWLNDFTLQGFFGPADADGVLGIGPNAVGPGPSSVITALPGDLNQGVLINQPGHTLEFVPNPLPSAPSVPGAPNATVYVSINGETPAEPVSAIIDSGGVDGTIPSSLLPPDVLAGSQADGGYVPDGTTITVYNSSGDELYKYTTSEGDGPTVISGDTMDTGNIPFAQQPVYIDYTSSGGTTFFEKPT